MKNYLKLPYEDYLKIQKTLDEIKKQIGDENPVATNKLLYIGNSLFECTHNFDTGKPYLHNDENPEYQTKCFEKKGPFVEEDCSTDRDYWIINQEGYFFTESDDENRYWVWHECQKDDSDPDSLNDEPWTIEEINSHFEDNRIKSK